MVPKNRKGSIMETLKKPAFCFVLLAATAAAVQALPQQLYDDPAAMSGMSGKCHFDTTSGSNQISADVSYAVYTAAAFATENGYDPSLGKSYIYAYQIWNGASDTSIDNFAVSVLASAHAVNVIYDISGGWSVGSIAPSSTGIVSASAYDNPTWRFGNAPLLEPGTHSAVLLFACNAAPSKDGCGQFNGSDQTFSIVAPQSAPEPLSITLLAGGLLSAWRFGKRS
jgi:hypothetical protein